MPHGLPSRRSLRRVLQPQPRVNGRRSFSFRSPRGCPHVILFPHGNTPGIRKGQQTTDSIQYYGGYYIKTEVTMSFVQSGNTSMEKARLSLPELHSTSHTINRADYEFSLGGCASSEIGVPVPTCGCVLASEAGSL